MKNNATAVVKIYEDHEKKQEFLTDSKSSIFVIFQNRIFPLHADVLFLCSYFQHQENIKQKVLFLQADIDMAALQKVLAALYGHYLQFVRGAEGLKIFETAMLLGAQKIIGFFQKDFENNFQQYGIFSLYNVARKYKIQWLQEKCLSDLLTCQFEQFHINRYDLMNSTKQTFQQILKQHHLLKSKGLTEGIEQKEVKDLIEEYSSINSTQVDMREVYSLTGSCDMTTQRLIQSVNCQKDRIRKRKLTWNCTSDSLPLENQVQVQPVYFLGTQQPKTSQEHSIIAQQLKQINREIAQNSILMVTQIKQAQARVSKSNAAYPQKFQKINKNLSEMAKIFEQQEQKLGRIKQLAQEIERNVDVNRNGNGNGNGKKKVSMFLF